MNEEELLESIEEIAERLILRAIRNNPVLDIEDFKAKMKDFLINPLWDSAYLLKERILKILENNNSEMESVLKKLETILDKKYEKYKGKYYIFDGKIREHEKELVEIIKEIASKRGQTPVMGAIIGYLLIHEGGLTQQQLKELSGYSIGSISTYLSSMEKVGFIKKSLIEGTKTYVYSFGNNLSNLTFNVGFIKREINEQVISFVENKLKKLKNFKEEKGHAIITERLQELLNFLKIREKLIKTIERLYKVDRYLES